MKLSKKQATILIFILAVALIIGIRFIKQLSRQWSYNSDMARTKGEVSAVIKVTEFIDFQCPACANGSKYLKNFMEVNPNTMHLELKYFPLDMHRHAYLASRYAECAAQQGKFWEYHDLLIDGQDRWKRLVNAQPAFVEMVESADIDKGNLAHCLKAEIVDELINSHIEEGKSLGVRSTPTYFVNDHMVVGKKSLVEEINKILKDAKN